MDRIEAPRTPAQWYSMVAGAFLLALGVLALVIEGVSFGTVESVAARPEFIIWEVSGWTTILWIAAGALGLFSMARVDAARTYALAAGIVFAVTAVWGFIDGTNAYGIINAGTTNNITHAVVGGLGLLVGMLPERQQRKLGVSESRESVVAQRRMEREEPRIRTRS